MADEHYFIINEKPPKKPYSASICYSLPTINFARSSLFLSQNKQMRKTGQVEDMNRSQSVIETGTSYYSDYFIIFFHMNAM